MMEQTRKKLAKYAEAILLGLATNIVAWIFIYIYPNAFYEMFVVYSSDWYIEYWWISMAYFMCGVLMLISIEKNKVNIYLYMIMFAISIICYGIASSYHYFPIIVEFAIHGLSSCLLVIITIHYVIRLVRYFIVNT